MASIGVFLFTSYLPWIFTEFNLQIESNPQQNEPNCIQNDKGKIDYCLKVG